MKKGIEVSETNFYVLCEIAILPICIRDFTIRTLFDVLFLEFFYSREK